MRFYHAVASCLTGYGTFSGRAGRSAFGYFMLFCVLLNLVMMVVDRIVFGIETVGRVADLHAIICLATLLPCSAVSVRRLYDLDRSGWWFLLFFAGPGIMVLLSWDCCRGSLGANRFGPEPIAQSD